MLALLRLPLLVLLGVVLGGCLSGVLFLLPAVFVLVEDGLDDLSSRSELGGNVHQLACHSGGLATQLSN
jgi:hypothetical protein